MANPINPATGREYTEAELQALALANPDNMYHAGSPLSPVAPVPGKFGPTSGNTTGAPLPAPAGAQAGIPGGPGNASNPGGAPVANPQANYSAALQDPEYLALLAQLDADLNNSTAELDAQGVDIRSRFGQQLRSAGQQLPSDLKRSTEGAAGRGMLYSGGLLEEQGDIQKRFADFNAQIGEDQTSQLNGLERNRNANRSNYNAKRESGLQGAVQRALVRAEQKAVADAAKAAADKAANPAVGGALPVGTPVSGAPVATPTAPVATPAATPPAAAVSPVPQNAGQVYTPRPITQQDRDQANASSYAGPNNPTQAVGITNPILRPGDSPTPNSPLYNTPNPNYNPGVNPNADNGQMTSYSYDAAGKQTATVQAPQAAPAPVARGYAPREMSSFDSKSQTILSLGGTVLAGGTTRVRYDPLTGKVVPVESAAPVSTASTPRTNSNTARY